MQGRGGYLHSSAHDSASARPRPGQRARDLGQTGRGRDLDSRGWCRDILFGVATWLRLGLKGPWS